MVQRSASIAVPPTARLASTLSSKERRSSLSPGVEALRMTEDDSMLATARSASASDSPSQVSSPNARLALDAATLQAHTNTYSERENERIARRLAAVAADSGKPASGKRTLRSPPVVSTASAAAPDLSASFSGLPEGFPSSPMAARRELLPVGGMSAGASRVSPAVERLQARIGNRNLIQRVSSWLSSATATSALQSDPSPSTQDSGEPPLTPLASAAPYTSSRQSSGYRRDGGSSGQVNQSGPTDQRCSPPSPSSPGERYQEYAFAIERVALPPSQRPSRRTSSSFLPSDPWHLNLSEVDPTPPFLSATSRVSPVSNRHRPPSLQLAGSARGAAAVSKSGSRERSGSGIPPGFTSAFGSLSGTGAALEVRESEISLWSNGTGDAEYGDANEAQSLSVLYAVSPPVVHSPRHNAAAATAAGSSHAERDVSAFARPQSTQIGSQETGRHDGVATKGRQLPVTVSAPHVATLSLSSVLHLDASERGPEASLQGSKPYGHSSSLAASGTANIQAGSQICLCTCYFSKRFRVRSKP